MLLRCVGGAARITRPADHVVWVELHHQLISPRSKGADFCFKQGISPLLKAAVSSACIYTIIISLVKCVDPKACT